MDLRLGAILLAILLVFAAAMVFVVRHNRRLEVKRKDEKEKLEVEHKSAFDKGTHDNEGFPLCVICKDRATRNASVIVDDSGKSHGAFLRSVFRFADWMRSDRMHAMPDRYTVKEGKDFPMCEEHYVDSGHFMNGRVHGFRTMRTEFFDGQRKLVSALNGGGQRDFIANRADEIRQQMILLTAASLPRVRQSSRHEDETETTAKLITARGEEI